MRIDLVWLVNMAKMILGFGVEVEMFFLLSGEIKIRFSVVAKNNKYEQTVCFRPDFILDRDSRGIARICSDAILKLKNEVETERLFGKEEIKNNG